MPAVAASPWAGVPATITDPMIIDEENREPTSESEEEVDLTPEQVTEMKAAERKQREEETVSSNR